jgi:thiol-disulfide isomerase/thioredoxin
MKIIHLITACLLCCGVAAALTACTSQSSSSSYTITGTAEGTQDGDTVFLCDMSYGVVQPVDTAYVKNGKFEFKGEAEEASFRVLLAIHNGRSVASAVFVLENADIRATLSADDSSEQGTIEGGPNNKLLKEYLDGLKTTTDAMEVTEYDRKFIIDHVPSAFSDILFGMRMQGFTEEQQEEILKLFGEKQPQYPVYKAIMAEREATKATAVGAQYTDIALPAPDGTPLRVSDFVAKNKYTLIDFWASWCGPCRAEMPTVVKAYENFHAKGLEIIGVSLDEDHDAWVKAIAHLRMPWPQMSDLKGWDCAGAKKYNVRSIPANVLIDQQGKIIAKDLRGNDLLDKMAELMK